MSSEWLKKVRIKAVIDRLRFTVLPVVAISREQMVRHFPRDGCGAQRWDIRDVGGTGSTFEVTLHDVDCLPAVNAIINRLRCRIALQREPELTILEVALDAWPYVPGTVDLERVAADMFKGAVYEPSDNSRSSSGEGAEGITGPDAAYKALLRGHTLYCGDKNDPAMVRCYVKRLDNGTPLPISKHRARYEIQLQGEEHPVSTVKGLEGYRFEQMSPMFLARTVRDDLPPVAALLAHRVPKLRRYPRTMRRARLFHSRAFVEFNKRVFATLEQLTRTVQSDRRSPFQRNHLAVLNDQCSVSTDKFFPAVADVTPRAISRLTEETLTILSYAVRGPRSSG